MVFIIWCIGGFFLLTIFLTTCGFILPGDRYRRRIWEKLGKPDVKSIDKLKGLYRQSHVSKSSKFNNKLNR
jgi:hypothetical protein